MAVVYKGERGLKNLRNKLGRFTSQMDEAPYRVFQEEAPRIEAEAKMETPIDTGDLRRSVKATVTRRGTKGGISVITLSASSVHDGYDYSAYQHNTPWLNHPRGGKAFYLRDPFLRGIERIQSRLGQEIKYDK